MSDIMETASENAPGDNQANRHGIGGAIGGYGIGLMLSIALTVASFWIAGTHAIYGPGIPIALVTLAVAQMGIRLVFFLHITTAPDHTNNVLALALGILTDCLVVFRSMWIMTHLNHNMMPLDQVMKMQR